MGISIRGMAIGALSRVKEKQDASAEEERQKRLENRKFKMEEKLQTQRDAAALQRTQVTADASSLSARNKLVAANEKAKNIAFTKLQETYDQYGLGGPKGLLGKNLPIQFRALRSKAQDRSYLALFDGAVGHVIEEFNKIQDSGLQTIQFNRLNEYLAKKLPQVLVQTKATETDTSRSGDYNHEQMFDLPTALKQTYKYMSTVDRLKEVLDKQKQEFDQMYKVPDRTINYIEKNTNSVIAQQLTRNFGKRELTIIDSLVPNWYGLRNSGAVKAFKENNVDGMRAAVDNWSTSKSLTRNDFKPQPNLDTIVATSIVALGHGKTIYISPGVGGIKKRTRFNPSIREKEIKDARESYNTSASVLGQITQAREINRTLQHGTDQSKKATFTLNIFRHLETFLYGLSKGLNLNINSEDKSIALSDSEKQDMANALSKVGIEDGEGFVQQIQDASNAKLAGAKDILNEAFKGRVDPTGRALLSERFNNEVKYEALKIQLVYKIAKMVQGGSGGQAVSNADFQAVLKSFQAGKWGTLEYEQAVFQQLQYMTEREYIYSKVMTSRAVLSNEDAVATRALKFHRIQYERMKQRKKQQNDQAGTATSPVSAEKRLKAEAARIEEEMLKKQSNVAAPG